MTSNRTSRELLPDPVVQVLDEYRRNFRMELGLWLPRDDDGPFRLYPRSGRASSPRPDSTLLEVPTRGGVDLILEISGEDSETRGAAANALRTTGAALPLRGRGALLHRGDVGAVRRDQPPLLHFRDAGLAPAAEGCHPSHPVRSLRRHGRPAGIPLGPSTGGGPPSPGGLGGGGGATGTTCRRRQFGRHRPGVQRWAVHDPLLLRRHDGGRGGGNDGRAG